MLSAVIVVLRETLEAAFLISLTLVYGGLARYKNWWLYLALAIALFGAGSLAHYMPVLSDSLEGVGQEVVFASLLIMIALAILFLNLSAQLLQCSSHYSSERVRVFNERFIISLLALALVLAVSLEGSEIIIYLQSATYQPGAMTGVIIGGLLGVGIGLSIGIIGYYGIGAMENKYTLVYVILTLIAAGMAAQAVAFTIQAGLIDGGFPVWDSSNIVVESSVVGQLLYALIGYEATPTKLQMIVYSTVLVIALLCWFFPRKLRSRTNNLGF